MATPIEITTIAGRLATFDGLHQLTKRRASSAKKKTVTSVSWPHQTPRPEDLARAGFYYKPSASSTDSVTCYLCEKALDGWDANDNPALEHLSHVPDCGWAVNVCIEQRNQDMDRVEENPLSEKMLEARRATFRDAWPHESKKGWKCKVQKMVEAGWCYNPLPEADDYVCCFYCGLSLDGWEPKDDPWDEHQRRAPECHFFGLIDEAKAPTKTKSKKTGTSRISRSSRLSLQSNLTVGSQAPSPISLDDVTEDEGDSVMATTSTLSRSTRQRKAPAKAKTSTKSKTTSKTKRVAAEEQPMKEELGTFLEDSEAPTFWAGGAEATALRAMTSPAELMDHSMEEEEPITKKAARKVVKKGKAQKGKRATENEDQLQAELKAEIEAAFASPQEAARPKRGKKRTNEGIEKSEESIIVIEKEAPKASPHNKQLLVTSEAIEVARTTNDELPIDAPLDREAISHTQSERVQSEDLREATTNTHATLKPVIEQLQEIAQEEKEEGEDDKDINNDEAANVTVHEQTPIASTADSQATEVATPFLSIDLGRVANVPQTVKSIVSKQEEMRSPSASSTQSSDAENKPPLGNGNFAMLQLNSDFSPSKAPFGARTPSASPSKRHLVPDGLSSSNPWKEIDLDSIFLASPSRQSPSKANLTVDDVMRNLTPQEQQMSVEEWILWNAKTAEEKLRLECERMIGLFEGEGVRALRTLEGLQSV